MKFHNYILQHYKRYLLSSLIVICNVIVSKAQLNPLWSTVGNSGTTSANFVGTIDPQPLIFKTSDTERMRITPAGDIGVNITAPASKFHIRDGSILFDGTTGNTPVSGGGTRLMWIPAKAAFRAGRVLATEWDNTNIGMYSAAFGSTTIAQSFACFVVGQYNQILTNYSATTWVATDPVFVVGNGQDGQKRYNAITVLKNGNTGIGTPKPINRLDVASGIAIGGGYAGSKTAPANGAIIRGNVGVNTPTPLNNLDVAGRIAIGTAYAGSNAAPANGAVIQGSVGIGTATPAAKLEVWGDARVVSNSANIVFTSIGSGTWRVYGSMGTTKMFRIEDSDAAADRFVIDQTGRVSIGTKKIVSGSHTNFKLSVDGKIVAKEIYVTVDNWADYVLAHDYKLMSLEQVEQYINLYKHLPKVPSENEVKENGNNLGEMDAILLGKIEELYLYSIQLKKENSELKQELEKIKELIKTK